VAADDVVIIAYQSGNAYIYHGNDGAGDTALLGANIALIGIVTGDVTVGGFDVSQFIN
jgi:ABC-type branched-subunit amino acid transport system ATPase component